MPTQGGKSPIATTLKLQGLCYHTELIGWARGIICRQVHVAHWKKAFTGNGMASKAKARATGGVYPVILACRQRGWQVRDDNEADALGLFVYACGLAAPKDVARFDPLMRAGGGLFQAA